MNNKIYLKVPFVNSYYELSLLSLKFMEIKET